VANADRDPAITTVSALTGVNFDGAVTIHDIRGLVSGGSGPLGVVGCTLEWDSECKQRSVSSEVLETTVLWLPTVSLSSAIDR